MPRLDLEFYETPQTLVKYLYSEHQIYGRVLEPCVGSGAIIRACRDQAIEWITNDLDPDFAAHYHEDATSPTFWNRFKPGSTLLTPNHRYQPIDHVCSNTPFTPAIEIIDHAIQTARESVAMYLRISIHEPLKEGIRRTWMHDHPPTKILFLPRFAYQRSGKTGKWTTDSATACWCIWNTADPTAPQVIRYPPEWVLTELDAETPFYRARMDALMGFTGSEKDRQAQRMALKVAA